MPAPRPEPRSPSLQYPQIVGRHFMPQILHTFPSRFPSGTKQHIRAKFSSSDARIIDRRKRSCHHPLHRLSWKKIHAVHQPCIQKGSKMISTLFLWKVKRLWKKILSTQSCFLSNLLVFRIVTEINPFLCRKLLTLISVTW